MVLDEAYSEASFPSAWECHHVVIDHATLAWGNTSCHGGDVPEGARLTAFLAYFKRVQQFPMNEPVTLFVAVILAVPLTFSSGKAADSMVGSVAPTTLNTTSPVWCRFVPERKDDFAWENDLMAFRAYGPAIKGGAEDSGIDCWLKRTTNPIVDEWYAGEQKGISYHEDHGDGYDPYPGGGSRGCGGTALWVDNALVSAGPYTTWKILERATSKAVFELTYDYPAKARESAIHEVKRFTVEQGKPFIEVTSTFTREGKPIANLPVALGVTTHDGKASVTLCPEKRWVSCWEVIDGNGLGTGVILDPVYPIAAREMKSEKKDRSHALIITKTDANGSVTCHPGFAWVREGRVAAKADWQAILSGFSKSLHPKNP